MLKALFFEIEVIEFSDGQWVIIPEKLLKGGKVVADAIEGLWVDIAYINRKKSFFFINQFKNLIHLVTF